MNQSETFNLSFDLIKACLRMKELLVDRNEADYFESEVILLDKKDFEEILSKQFFLLAKLILNQNLYKQNKEEIANLVEVLLGARMTLNKEVAELSVFSHLDDDSLQLAS